MYSTCTFAPEENEGTVARLLKRFQEALRVEPVELPGGPLALVDYAHTPDGLRSALAATRALTEGDLGRAVQASASIPGVFPPVWWQGMLLVDGYITKNVPVPEPGEPPYRSDVIVVDVQRRLESHGPWDNGLEVVARALVRWVSVNV